MEDLKFTACQLMFEGLVTYSKVKRVNRGYVTHYTIKLTLGVRMITSRRSGLVGNLHTC